VGISVALFSGIILAAGGRVLALARPALSARGVPVWLSAVVAGLLALIAVVVSRRIGRGAPQAFIVVSAFVQTAWLGGLLNNLAWSLDRHGIDLVVKLPAPDYGGQSLIQQLARLRRHRRSYIGGLVVATQPEVVRNELTAFCQAARLPVVFVDVRPFPAGHRYPPGTAFTGCDAAEIGERAAEWVAGEMRGRHQADPAILVICGDTQHDRQARFAARIKDLLPSAVLSLSQPGPFSRERAREIAGHHLRRGDRLDAAFCTNDQMALGAADAIREHAASGHRHENPVVIGVDGIEEALAVIKSGTTPLKATIAQDTQHIADAAVNLLLRLRAGQQVPAETLIPTTIYASS
jgi:ABC-type sugar transport system substrate-binding protein